MKLTEILLFENYKLALQDFSKEESSEKVRNILDKFKSNQQRISDLEKRDINYWRRKGFTEFAAYVDQIANKETKKTRRTKIKSASDEILTIKKTDDIHLFIPLSKEASCFYGHKGERGWCISTRDGTNMFYKYTQLLKFVIIFLIHENDVYAMVIDPQSETIEECQDKTNRNNFHPKKFFEYAQISREELIEYIYHNQDKIFSNISKKYETETLKRALEHVNDLIDVATIKGADNIEIDTDLLKYIKENRPELLKKIEPIIAKSPENSYDYASFVLNGRFELGEPAIAQEGTLSYQYAVSVLKGRFELGEPAIVKDNLRAFMYIMEMGKGVRILSIEKAIAKSARLSYQYANLYLKGRFKLGEPAIAREPMYAKEYKKKIYPEFEYTENYS